METNHKEFLELLEPLQQTLTAYVRHLLWNKPDLEDGLQNVLTEAYRKFGDFKTGSNFKNWIFQMATFTVFNMNRRYQKLTTESAPSLQISDPVSSETLWQEEDYRKLLTNPDSVLDKMSDEVRTSLKVLNENERAVFLLRSLGELAYAEIAQTLDIPIGSVMGNLSRARTKLRNQLTQYAKEQGLL